jgi:hypothetical protein
MSQMPKNSLFETPWWCLFEIWGKKPIKRTYPKFFFSSACVLRSQFMLPAHFDGLDRGAQIYGSQSFPDPPDRSAFNRGGGGSGIGDKICTDLDGPETSA